MTEIISRLAAALEGRHSRLRAACLRLATITSL